MPKILKNTSYNLLGMLVPQLVVLITVPLYINKIGDARYGVLALIWVFIGYFGVLDLGLSRATSNYIAKFHDSPPKERQIIFWTALGLNGVLGVLGGLCVALLGRFLLGTYFNIPVDLRSEVLSAVPWMAFSVPVMTIAGVLTGTLEAHGKFFAVNLVQTAGSFAFQIIPILIAYFFSVSLSWLIPAAVVARFLTIPALFFYAYRVIPIEEYAGPEKRWVKPLIGYGGWIAVTNFIAPLLTSFDQLFVAKFMGAREVAWYSIPYSLTWRMTILPSAFHRVAFPELSKMTDSAAKIFAISSLRYIALIFAPFIVLAVLLARPFITLWLGPELSVRTSSLAVIFLAGVWVSALATILLNFIQASGRPDIAAKVFACEILPFWGMLWLGFASFGLNGIAAAGVFRSVVDFFVFLRLSGIRSSDISVVFPAAVVILIAVVLVLLVPCTNALFWACGLGIFVVSTLFAFSKIPELSGKVLKIIGFKSSQQVA